MYEWGKLPHGAAVHALYEGHMYSRELSRCERQPRIGEVWLVDKDDMPRCKMCEARIAREGR